MANSDSDAFVCTTNPTSCTVDDLIGSAYPNPDIDGSIQRALDAVYRMYNAVSVELMLLYHCPLRKDLIDANCKSLSTRAEQLADVYADYRALIHQQRAVETRTEITGALAVETLVESGNCMADIVKNEWHALASLLEHARTTYVVALPGRLAKYHAHKLSHELGQRYLALARFQPKSTNFFDASETELARQIDATFAARRRHHSALPQDDIIPADDNDTTAVREHVKDVCERILHPERRDD